MPKGTIRPGIPQGHTTRQTRYWYNARGETRKNPSIKKLVGPAEEAEYKVHQYCYLWTMYADSSVELKKKSELSQESAVAACKMYIPYISDIT